MKSMTGHGRGEGVFQGRQVVAELHSVNRKQLEIVCNLPKPLAACEGALRDFLTPQLSRGRVTLSISIQEGGRGAKGTFLDPAAAARYHQELEALRRELKIAEPVSLELVLRGPGVVREGAETEDAEAWAPVLLEAAKKALVPFFKMRQAEGRHLAADLLKRLREMEGAVKKISRRAPAVAERHRELLRARLAEAGTAFPLDDERLLKEVAIFDDRSDVSEELARLGSHFAQFKKLLEGDEAAGRSLDFLTQELNREINTIGSKANDVEIAHHVVALKSALEKIREQIQNFE